MKIIDIIQQQFLFYSISRYSAIETLNLTGEDKLIITSSEKREGFGLVMQMLDDVYEEK